MGGENLFPKASRLFGLKLADRLAFWRPLEPLIVRLAIKGSPELLAAINFATQEK